MERDLKWFINQVLVKEVGIILLEHKHHYLSFSLISQGIEFLGACLDNKPLHVNKEGGERFRKALKDLFPNKYKQFAKKGAEYDLYNNLRSGLMHILIPKNKIELIQPKEKAKFKAGHLDIVRVRNSHMRLILVSEDFYNDFKQACKKIIKMFEENKLNGNQVLGNLIELDP